jgi:hypothetical protein
MGYAARGGPHRHGDHPRTPRYRDLRHLLGHPDRHPWRGSGDHPGFGRTVSHKKDIFAATYEETVPDRYRKKARSRLVQVPEGVVAVLTTREGEIEVRHPDYVAIGAENEVYANSAQWMVENLTFV